MRNEVISVLLIAAIIAGAGVGYFVGVNSVTSVTSSKGQTSVTTTSCTVSGPTNGVVIRVVEGGLYGPTIPIVGALVNGEADGYCNDALQTLTLQSAATNSSGWASLLDEGFGVYNLNISYEVGNPQLTENYHLSVPMQPLTTTYVVFNTTTGNVTTHYCEYNLHCFSGS